METDLHITPYIRKLLAQHPPRLAFSAADRAGWETWREELRGKLVGLLAPWPQTAGLRAVLLSTTDAGSHVREALRLSSDGLPDIPALLLRPKGAAARRPAILALHGHGPGKAEVAGLDAGDAQVPYGLRMVEAGYVVLTFDFFPFGERRESEHNAQEGYEYSCNSTLIRTLLLGVNLLTLNLFDVRRALDYLVTRPEVDAGRIGVMGCSYGGTASMYAATLDERIKAAVLSCSLGEYRGHGVEIDELCGVQVVPGILQWAEMGDVAGLIAPKPLLTESARADTFFPWSWTEPTLRRLREVYRTAGAQERLDVRVYDGGHRYYGEGVLEFWEKYL